jgi:hypothetical protein
MGRFCGAFLALTIIIFASNVWCDDDLDASSGAMECGQDRYQDFVQVRKNREKMAEERQKGASAVRSDREARVKQLEAARRSFHRTDMQEDPKLEAQWQEEQKAARAKHEVNRQRYVQYRDHELKTRCKGVQIPELLEYDLQDY